MKCLDTDFLIAVLRGKKEAKNKMESLDKEGVHATTAINAFELFSGARLSKDLPSSMKAVTMLFSRLEILSMDSIASNTASKIHAALVKKGKVIEFRDVFIGSIALNRGLVLVTRNTRHFSRISNLRLEAW